MPLHDVSGPGGRVCANLVIGALLAIGTAHAAAGQELTHFPLPTPGNRPQSITAGPDGNLWFTAFAYDGGGNVASTSVGRITPAGAISEFPIAALGYGGDIVAGPDGNLWFTEPTVSRIGRMSTAGVLTGEFATPTPNSYPWGITAGPDGSIWFVGQNGNEIVRMTTSGVVTGQFVIPTPATNTRDIVPGPDGNLWFTETGGNKIGRITMEGVIREFEIPTAESLPHGIAAGPDGALWFAEGQGRKIGRMSTSGSITEFPAGGAMALVSGPDGNLWFTEDTFVLGQMSTTGELNYHSVPDFVSDIAVGPDGALWLTEEVPGSIGRMTTGPCTPNSTTLCLGGRFSVRASWQAARDATNGQAAAVPTSGRSGYFWFSEAGNIEVAVKILDGCTVNDHVWFFAAGLTNAEVAIAVLDTETGAYRSYTSAGGSPFLPIQDVEAFSICP